MTQTYLLLAIALLGAVGAVARYLISLWANQWFGGSFPVGTLIVNLVGCFLIGLLMEWQVSSSTLSANVRLALTAGFLGALTTFSTFGYETVIQLERGAWGAALANVLANLTLGLLCVTIGTSLFRTVITN